MRRCTAHRIVFGAHALKRGECKHSRPQNGHANIARRRWHHCDDAVVATIQYGYKPIYLAWCLSLCKYFLRPPVNSTVNLSLKRLAVGKYRAFGARECTVFICGCVWICGGYLRACVRVCHAYVFAPHHAIANWTKAMSRTSDHQQSISLWRFLPSVWVLC